MAGGETVYGADEILDLTSYPSAIFIGIPFTISGKLKGSIKSQQVQMKMDGVIVQTVDYDDGFSFTHTVTKKENNSCTIDLVGVSLGVENSNTTLNINVKYPPFAKSVAMIYTSLASVLEDNFDETIKQYDPLLQEGDGISSLIDKIKEL